MFRNLVIFTPSEKTDPRAIYILIHWGFQNAYKLYCRNFKIRNFVYIEICVTVLDRLSPAEGRLGHASHLR
jgi:hypothetical protein